MRRTFFGLLALLFFAVKTAPVHAQQTCPPVPIPAEAPGSNLFTPQQGMELGDIVAEHVGKDFRVIEDEEVTGLLQQVGSKLLATLPDTGVKIRFFAFDLPIANAYSMPGGRIYVSRKLIAMLRNEDELAGVLAHEIGHEITRQPSQNMSRDFRQVLRVTSIGDENDIAQKYNDLMESVVVKRNRFPRDEKLREADEIVADAIGLYAARTAGYDPQKFIAFFDRLAQLHGKTGGWLSDLFGTTNPESRRLREMLKEEGAIPPACIGTRTAISPDELTAWQTRVINYTGLGHKEALHAVLSKKILTPPLRDDLNHLRFSPDGNYLLAQDDASIYVLSREPFESLFRIDAPDAYPAEFSPDSQSLVFYTPNLRVESWNVVDGTRTSAHEVAVLRRCLQTALSPDGKFLACLDSQLTLALFNVAAGTPVFEKKEFHQLTFNEYFQFLFALLLGGHEINIVTMRFSPDARYFIAARNTDELALELPGCTKFPLPSGVRNFLQIEFTFMGPDRLAGVGWGRGDKSGVVKFPSGELLNTITLGSQELTGAEHGDYLMLKPIKDHSLGVLDIRTNKIVGVNEKTAQDIYDSTMATESISGRVGLYTLDTNKPLAFADLPIGPLGNLRAAAVSKSLTWLAVSGTSRGAIWDLTKGQRVFNLRGFRGAYFGDDGSVYADFPKFKSANRSIGRMDLLTTQASGGPALDESSSVIQRGPFLISLKPEKSGAFGDKENPTLEVRDVRTGASLWTRAMRGASPRIWADVTEGTLVLGWPLSSSEAHEEIKKDAAAAQRVAPVKSSDENYFLQVVNALDGHVLGSIAVDTSKGAFRLNRAIAAGDRIVAFDSANRILVYSLSAGTEAGRLFGGNAVATSATSLLAVENEPGKLAIYDLKTLAKRDDFVFSSRIAMMQFNEVGTKLFVLTAAQDAYVLDMTTSLRPPAKTSN